MATIPENWLTGGTGLCPTGTDSMPTLAEALRDVADDLADLGGSKPTVGSVVTGGILADPTTGSTQATGTGNTDWNINVGAGVYDVNGVVGWIDAEADFDIHSGSFLTGLVNGASCIAAIVVQNSSGTLSVQAVTGTPATTGSQVAPTSAEIDTALSSLPWIMLGTATINRTGDTTVTESWSMQTRTIGYASGVTTLRTLKG